MKNNETFNKFIAGLVDGDGCITTNYHRTRNGMYKARFHFSIVFNRNDYKVRDTIEEIRDYFGYGNIYDRPDCGVIVYEIYSADNAISAVNRFKKHLVIKGKHADRMIELFKETKGYGNTLTEDEAEKKRLYVKWSRDNTTSIKPKKHLTNPWLAGYIEADGCLFYRKASNDYLKMGLDFSCNKRDLPALELISKAFGREIKVGRENEITLRHYFSKKSNTAAKRILIPLLPHLRSKLWTAEQILSHKRFTRRD